MSNALPMNFVISTDYSYNIIIMTLLYHSYNLENGQIVDNVPNETNKTSSHIAT